MRLFIAFDIPGEVSEKLKIVQKDIPGKIKLVESFHQTLKFLGDVEEDKVNRVVEKLENINMESFEVTVKNIGVFPNPEYVKIVWVGLESEGKIEELQKQVEEQLKEMGLKQENQFHAHVTLARVKQATDDEKKKIVELEVPEMKFQVDCVRLYKSRLGSEGPEYTVLKDIMLGKKPI